ncbi:hypothetical protein MXB_1605 [Myxobolus squamalis]|nr:hypothetical protein MXB_1605 [Myxobolus squamalis]
MLHLLGLFKVDKVLEFVPPNGSFELMTYTIIISNERGNCLPFVVTTNQDLSDVEGVVIVAHLPQDAKDCEIVCQRNIMISLLLAIEKCIYSNYCNTLTWDVIT